MRLKGHGNWPGVTTDAARRVIALELSNNRLAGPLPAVLGRLDRLKELRLAGNRLSGRIPAELGGLRRLESLDLRDNQLSGSVPPEWAGLDRLAELRLSGSGLSGPLPEPLRELDDRSVSEETEADERTPPRAAAASFPRAADRADEPPEPKPAEARVAKAGDIEKVGRELAENERSLADIRKQAEAVARENAEYDARVAELESRKSDLKNEKAALTRARDDAARVISMIPDLREEIGILEAAVEKLDDRADFALRVHDAGQEFGKEVERFLKSDRKRRDAMRRIAERLRLHLEDDEQIFEALKKSETPEHSNLDGARTLIETVARNLGDLDRLLGDATSDRETSEATEENPRPD